MTPAVNDQASYFAAAMWYGYFNYVNGDPRMMYQFADSVYKSVQDDGMNMGSVLTWQKILGNVQLKLDKNVKDDVMKSIKLIDTYGINSTPSMIIFGKYVIDLEIVNGDVNSFMQLANGLISKEII
jgi:thiol:disulfide interchange protein DsbA